MLLMLYCESDSVNFSKNPFGLCIHGPCESAAMLNAEAFLQRNHLRRRRAKENNLSTAAVVAGLTKISLQMVMTVLIKLLYLGL